MTTTDHLVLFSKIDRLDERRAGLVEQLADNLLAAMERNEPPPRSASTVRSADRRETLVDRRNWLAALIWTLRDAEDQHAAMWAALGREALTGESCDDELRRLQVVIDQSLRMASGFVSKMVEGVPDVDRVA